MQSLRKRIEKLEKSQRRNRGPVALVIGRDPVTGDWMGSSEIGAVPVVLFHSAISHDPELIADRPARVIDMAAQ